MNADVHTSEITIRTHLYTNKKADEKGGEDPNAIVLEAKLVTQILKPRLRRNLCVWYKSKT